MLSQCAITRLNDVPCRRDGLRCRPLDDEAVLYDPAHHTLHYLNQTAYFIWARCDGRRRVQDIADAVAAAYETGCEGQDSGGQERAPDPRVLGDVRRTLAELADNGLIDSGCLDTHDATCCNSDPS